MTLFFLTNFKIKVQDLFIYIMHIFCIYIYLLMITEEDIHRKMHHALIYIKRFQNVD